MKTRFLFISAFLFVALLTNSLRASDPVYLNVISNSSKTIDYTVGVYPLTIKNEPENDRTTISMYLLNNGSKTLYWTKMNHVMIILKDYTLKHNYVTKAESGLYCCSYSVDPTNGFHEQTLCFDGIFTANDIAKVFLYEDNDIYSLDFVAGN